MEKIEEHMMVVLTTGQPRYALKAGDVGCVVMEHGDQVAFEVEFEPKDEDDITVLTLKREQIRVKQPGEILHVRAIA